MLRTDNAIYPRDLSLNLFSGFCSRLTSWNHPFLGEPFMIGLHQDVSTPEQLGERVIELAELSSDRNSYIFKPTSCSYTWQMDCDKQVLDENNRLPTLFRLKGGDGGLVKSVSITRYNKVISGVDFFSLWDCINVCSAVADSKGLLLGEIQND